MSNKTIKINPLLFSVNGISKKNKKKPTNVPLISPNILKNKLLKRIKDHKNKETTDLDSKKKTEETNNTIINDNTNYTDEFNDSIEYLQSLSKQKQTNLENENRKEQIQKKTIKKYNSSSVPIVNLELPEELKETNISISNNLNTSSNNIPITINNKLDNVPYGVLKGGQKPTYRQWAKTQKNYQPENNNLSNNNILNKPISDREQRLNLLKQKLQKQTSINTQPLIETQSIIKTQPIINTQPIIETQPIINTQPIIETQTNLEEIILTQNLIQKSNNNSIVPTTNINENMNNLALYKEPEKIRTVKKLLKRTIHKKYTLGKSNIKRTVAVLLKNQHTRKKIIDAQKDLKKKPVNDVKTYLRQHNLIKIGSNAPTDIIRKIYESAVLAGEITNNNKDTMLHNFMKNDVI